MLCLLRTLSPELCVAGVLASPLTQQHISGAQAPPWSPPATDREAQARIGAALPHACLRWITTYLGAPNAAQCICTPGCAHHQRRATGAIWALHLQWW